MSSVEKLAVFIRTLVLLCSRKRHVYKKKMPRFVQDKDSTAKIDSHSEEESRFLFFQRHNDDVFKLQKKTNPFAFNLNKRI